MDTFVGDVLVISLDAGVDLTGYTLYICYTKPDGTDGRWNATQCISDDSVAVYTTAKGDLDQAGTWKLHIYATSLTFRGHGRIIDFLVQEPLTALTTAAPTTAAPTTAGP